MAKSQKRLKAEDIVARFPNTQNAPLAQLMCKENKLLFNGIEDARIHIRRVRGAVGKIENAKVKNPKKFASGKIENPYSLPAQEKQRSSVPYKISVNENTRLAILPDLHLPYLDNTAMTAALDYLVKYQPTHIILNGDLLDCYSLSTFEQRPDERDFKYEIEVARTFLKGLRDVFATAQIIFKFGNHDERWEKFLWRKAPEVWGFEEFHLEKMLHLKDLNIECVKDKRRIFAGKIVIMHGHEFPRSMGSVSPARTFYLKSQTSVIGSHHHQISSYSTKDLKGNSHVAYSTGCLCLLNPDYAPINNWDNGFATIDFLSNDGSFRVNNFKIINGQIF